MNLAESAKVKLSPSAGNLENQKNSGIERLSNVRNQEKLGKLSSQIKTGGPEGKALPIACVALSFSLLALHCKARITI